MSSCKGPLHIEVTPEVYCIFSPQFHEYKFRSGITNYNLSHWKYFLVIAVPACKQEQEPYSWTYIKSPQIQAQVGHY